MIGYLRKKQKREEDFKGLLKKIDLLNRAMNMVMPQKLQDIISKDYLGALKTLARKYSAEYSKLGKEERLKITRPYLFQNNNGEEEIDYAEMEI